MPNIALEWDPGTEVPKTDDETAEVERIVSQIFEKSRLKLELVKITHHDKGIKIFTQSEQCIENMQEENIKRELKNKLKLSFHPSNARMAKHTLTMRPFNAAIYDYDDQYIIKEVRRAAYLSDDAQIKLYKNKAQRMLKLTFEHQSVADSVKERGFSIGGWSIPNYSIRYEEHFAILQCMKCFEFESHATNQCKIKYQICSECASRTHTFRNCPNPRAAKCVNCLKKGADFNHRTLANSCPEKRKIILRKRKEAQEQLEIKDHLPLAKAVSQMIVQQSSVPIRETNRWADIVSQKQTETTTATQQNTPGQPEKKKKKKTNDLIKNILVCTINAHLHNRSFPGTYNQKLNYMLMKNEIPYTDVGDDWDSEAILKSLEDDLSEMEEDVTVIRDSPNVAPPPTDSSPIQVELRESPPKEPRCLSLESVESETSVEEEENAKKSGKEHPKKRKKKKKRKKEEYLTEQKWVEGWWPNTSEEDYDTEEENQKKMDGREPAAVKLEFDCEEVQAELAIRIFLDEKTPSDEERMLLFTHFKSLDEDIQRRKKMSQSEKIGLAYWSCFSKKRMNEQNMNITEDLKQRAKTWKEIKEAEEDYRRQSYERYGRKKNIEEETDKFHHLIRKRHLIKEEKEELKEMYMHCAQCNIASVPNLVIARLIALYRTQGHAFTKFEYKAYRGVSNAAKLHELSWTEDSDSYIGEDCQSPEHSFSF